MKGDKKVGAISDYRAYDIFGCHWSDTQSCRFAVWAPNAREVAVVGDFNGWDAGATPMNRDENGVWSVELAGIEKGEIYKYAVTSPTGELVLKADPFAFFAEVRPATASRVWDIEGYDWQDDQWMKKRAAKKPHSLPISIYELHVGSWRKSGEDEPTYRELATQLAQYCVEMGFTHIEIMPVTEYPFDGSWGYQTTGYFAPTSRYGTPQDFMYFVETLHMAGIGVLMDWVPAHFPRDIHGLVNFDGTPIFEGGDERMAQHAEWGTMTFDYANPDVRKFLVSSAMIFFDKYHIDGLRVDAVSSMLYLDYGRKPGEFTPNKDGGHINLGAVEFLKELNTAILSTYPGAITAAEESTAFPLVTAPPYDGGLGFSFKWDMGFMHDTLEYFALDPLFRKGSHEKLSFSMVYAFSESFILAFSHDEVVHGKASMLGKMFGEYEQKFATLRALYGYQFAHPGKKLIFMGSEFGQFIEWNYKQELDWMLLEYPSHDGLREYVSQLNRFYKNHSQLFEIDGSWDGFEWKSVDERERSSIAFLRRNKAGKSLLCAFNFTPVEAEIHVSLPEKSRPRTLFSSNEERFGGDGEKARYSKGVLKIPPMCAVYMSV